MGTSVARRGLLDLKREGSVGPMFVLYNKGVESRKVCMYVRHVYIVLGI